MITIQHETVKLLVYNNVIKKFTSDFSPNSYWIAVINLKKMQINI